MHRCMCRVQTCVYAYSCIDAYIHADGQTSCMHAYIIIYIHTYAYMHAYVCMYVCICRQTDG